MFVVFSVVVAFVYVRSASLPNEFHVFLACLVCRAQWHTVDFRVIFIWLNVWHSDVMDVAQESFCTSCLQYHLLCSFYSIVCALFVSLVRFFWLVFFLFWCLFILSNNGWHSSLFSLKCLCMLQRTALWLLLEHKECNFICLFSLRFSHFALVFIVFCACFLLAPFTEHPFQRQTG